MPYKGFWATNSAFTDNVPGDGGVFSMHVKYFVSPFSQLGNRVYKLHHLMAGFPLQTKIIQRKSIKHHLPGEGIVGNIPVSSLPVTTHVAILKSQPYTFICRSSGQLSKHFFKARYRFINGPVYNTSGKTSDQVSAKKMGAIDEPLPAGQRIRALTFPHQGVTEKGKAGNNNIVSCQNVSNFLCHVFQVYPSGSLPKSDAERFKTIGY